MTDELAAPMTLVESTDDLELDSLYDMLSDAGALDDSLLGLARKNHLAALFEGQSQPISEQHQILDSLRQGIADFHESVQQTTNIRSQPPLRSLSLLDMPAEILIHICGYAKGWEGGEHFSEDTAPPMAVNTVKSLRLTCRKLHDASSHLLIHFLCVAPDDPQSVSRLDEVSGHPLVRKGVQGIRVVLHTYDGFIASSFLAFAGYQTDLLLESIEPVEETANFRNGKNCLVLLGMS
ncbi:hypothetical protein BKA65DRAFT_149850 [Rhexocercosporidium sp. MPI-PUGE-AT-0058]|nr:hypothetical protein BKA65DRAFT_149850 [Rhexocercosporidium sp. MPI-PUGE-AT-0058]